LRGGSADATMWPQLMEIDRKPMLIIHDRIEGRWCASACATRST
jgi:hypothetical protein